MLRASARVSPASRVGRWASLRSAIEAGLALAFRHRADGYCEGDGQVQGIGGTQAGGPAPAWGQGWRQRLDPPRLSTAPTLP